MKRDNIFATFLVINPKKNPNSKSQQKTIQKYDEIEKGKKKRKVKVIKNSYFLLFQNKYILWDSNANIVLQKSNLASSSSSTSFYFEYKISAIKRKIISIIVFNFKIKKKRKEVSVT